MALTLSACTGSDGRDAAPTTSIPVEARLPIPLSTMVNTAAVATEHGIVVIDGSAATTTGMGTAVWIVDGDRRELIAITDTIGHGPVAWAGSDHMTHAVVTRCDDATDDRVDLRCNDASLVLMSIDPVQATVDVRPMGLATQGQFGFTAVRGQAATLISTYRNVDGPDPSEGIVTHYLADGESQAVEVGRLGVITACPSGDGFVVYPSGINSPPFGEQPVWRVTDGRAEELTVVGPLPGSINVTTCLGDGAALAQGNTDADRREQTIRVTDGSVAFGPPPDLPEPPTGSSIQLIGDRWVAWSATFDEDTGDYRPLRTLHVLEEGQWDRRGTLESADWPAFMTFTHDGSTAYAGVIVDGGVAFDEVDPTG